MSRVSTHPLRSLGNKDHDLDGVDNGYSIPKGTYLLNQEEVSQLFRVTKRTVQRWTQLDLIPSVKVGRVTRYDIGEVRRVLGYDEDYVPSISETPQ